MLRATATKGEGHYLLLGHFGSGAGLLGDTYFKDIDNDGVDEYISFNYESFDPEHPSEAQKIKSVDIHKWNGSYFKYSRPLSRQFGKGKRFLKKIGAN